jgi:hypothetical protein
MIPCHDEIVKNRTISTNNEVLPDEMLLVMRHDGRNITFDNMALSSFDTIHRVLEVSRPVERDVLWCGFSCSLILAVGPRKRAAQPSDIKLIDTLHKQV